MHPCYSVRSLHLKRQRLWCVTIYRPNQRHRESYADARHRSWRCGEQIWLCISRQRLVKFQLSEDSKDRHAGEVRLNHKRGWLRAQCWPKDALSDYGVDETHYLLWCIHAHAKSCSHSDPLLGLQKTVCQYPKIEGWAQDHRLLDPDGDFRQESRLSICDSTRISPGQPNLDWVKQVSLARVFQIVGRVTPLDFRIQSYVFSNLLPRNRWA